MSGPFVAFLGVIAFMLAVCGATSGGWAQELGRVYYCYAIYVGCDALKQWMALRREES